MGDRIATIIFLFFASSATLFILGAKYDSEIRGDNTTFEKFIYFGLPIALFLGGLLYLFSPPKRRPPSKNQ